MIHLTRADYRVMPWANGKGQTVEMLREDGPEGMRLRLSMAAVVEPGAFSIFPGIERVLTVIDGPGFDLHGDGLLLRCDPLLPVAFPGDVPIRAERVSAPSMDFNVMVARGLPAPQVQVLRQGKVAAPQGGRVCLLALDSGDLWVSDAELPVPGLSIAVQLAF